MKKRRPRGTACQFGKRCIAVGTFEGKRGCALHLADAMFASQVRAVGRCWATGYALPCEGYLECAHVISRRYKAIRWSFDNARCLCQAHHWYWTVRPQEWIEYVTERGINYWALHRRALDEPPERPLDVIARLAA